MRPVYRICPIALTLTGCLNWLYGVSERDADSRSEGGVSDAAVTPIRDAAVATDVTCSNGLTVCAAACTDLAYDPANCGSCGHVCDRGKTCTMGSCVALPTCPTAPAGATADQIAALELENTVRGTMGIPCATMVATANLSATRHCTYYSHNRSTPMCVANSHVEVNTCPMYVAANFWDRLTAAGYAGTAAFEDMAFYANGTSAVQHWIDSIWHRTPVLSPWVRDIGYGSAMQCDTMDFGVGADTPMNTVATYPYAHQTGVPTSFDGRYESPTPPTPSSGWPSGYPIHIYKHGGTITTHELTVAGTTALIPHTFIAERDDVAMRLLPNANVMYAHAPLLPGTRYHVHIAGSNDAGPIMLDWDFTTR